MSRRPAIPRVLLALLCVALVPALLLPAAEAAAAAPRCGDAPPPPTRVRLVFERDPGASGGRADPVAAADAVLDAAGRLVLVEPGGDLLRQRPGDAAPTPWAAGVARRVRGLAWLPTGELVVADGGRGALVAVFGAGETRLLVPHLDGPTALAAGSDGLWVVEALRPAVTRVDRRTGALARVADGLPVTPTALAPAPDGRALYLVTADSGTVGALRKDAAGRFGPLTALVTLPWSAGPCAGRAPEAACVRTDGGAGRCRDDGAGALACLSPGPCEGAAAGDPCDADGTPGTCAATPAPPGGGAALACHPIAPCAGRADDERCAACDGRRVGAPCVLADRAGTCLDDGRGDLACRPDGPCRDRAPGARCALRDGTPGRCADGRHGERTCQPAAACAGRSERDGCVDPGSGAAGRCVAAPAGGRYCRVPNPCAGRPPGAVCAVGPDAAPGTCRRGVEHAWCAALPPCAAGQPGDFCLAADDAPGVCAAPGGGPLACREGTRGCAGRAAGDACRGPDAALGACVDDGDGRLVCLRDPCRDARAGDVCALPHGRPGACGARDDGRLACRPVAPCAGRAPGDACRAARTGTPGVCERRSERRLVCQPTPPCEGRAPGDACRPRPGAAGRCERTPGGGALWCRAVGLTGAALTAVETDACGNVYVADDASAAIWRVSPGRRGLRPVASTGGAPVTRLAWGAGEGDETTLYAITAGGADVFAVDVGRPRRPGGWPAVAAPAPRTPPDDPAHDCLHLPDGPLETTELDGPRGFHDVAFDLEGWLVGSDRSLLVRARRGGPVLPYAPLDGQVEGMDWLPDGSLVVSSTGLGLVRVLPSGAQEVLAPNVHAYGVTVGPDGLVYAADHTYVWRVDPVRRATAVWLAPQELPEPWAPRTLAFDRDHSLAYVGSHGAAVHVVALDAALNPIGPPRRFAVVRPGARWLDGLTVDVCGNLYVPVYEASALYRITPDGAVTLYLQQTREQYGHGVEWGSGLGGWRADALYLPQPYDGDTVVEVVVGLPGARRTPPLPLPHPRRP
jgi:sugar lactone lactonase YvrE